MTRPPRDNARVSAAATSATGLSRWAWATLYAVCGVVLLADAGHFLPPAGEHFVDYLPPGAADLLPTVNAANALLHGDNPYRARSLFVHDPYEASRGSHEGVTYLYPPSHALLYVPLTYLASGDYERAQRLQFGVELFCICLLAFCIARLLGEILSLAPATQYALMPALALALGLNPGNQLGLERGQSDLITSAFGWCAVLAMSRQRLLTAAFMSVAACVLKGYGVLFASGLLFIGLFHDWRRTLLGASAAVCLLFAPVANYLPDAFAAYRIRSAMFWPGWTNQSFANLSLYLGAPRDEGRLLLTIAALGCSVLAWLQLRRIPRTPETAWQRSLWLCAFATAAFASVLGYSLNSIAYDAVIVMPGALILALSQDRLLERCSRLTRALVGAVLCVSLAAVFIFDVGRALGTDRWHVPASALGQVGVLAVIGFAATRALGAASRRYQLGMRAAGLVFVVGAVVYLQWDTLDAWTAGPDLADGKPWTASSAAIQCLPAHRNCGGLHRGVFFHTQMENEPWVRIDLGAEHEVQRIELQNRLDCCKDRAVPLIAELSKDGTSFHAVARRDEVFDTWHTRFAPESARYVRIRVLRRSALHLERVDVR
jgi:hypothetical protein